MIVRDVDIKSHEDQRQMRLVIGDIWVQLCGEDGL